MSEISSTVSLFPASGALPDIISPALGLWLVALAASGLDLLGALFPRSLSAEPGLDPGLFLSAELPLEPLPFPGDADLRFLSAEPVRCLSAEPGLEPGLPRSVDAFLDPAPLDRSALLCLSADPARCLSALLCLWAEDLGGVPVP